jgi:hypothetical protein
MRNLGLFIALTSFVWVGTARAQVEKTTADSTATSEPAAVAPASGAESAPALVAAAPASKMQVGIAFLPMLMGSMGRGPSGDDSWDDMSPAYGVGLSFGYNVVAGLSVGVAPQVLFHVKPKANSDSAKEYDLVARIAYAYAVIPKLSVVAELLPGYSIISLPDSMTYLGDKPPKPKGLVLGAGAGAAYDISDLLFVNLGIGYQMGFQKMTVGSSDMDVKTKFLRIAVGGGVKF